MRSFDEKMLANNPDEIDLILIEVWSGNSNGGKIIPQGRLFTVQAKGAGSKLDTVGATVYNAIDDIVLVNGDKVSIVGRSGKYAAMDFWGCDMADNETDFIINGKGLSLNKFNDCLQDGYRIIGNISKIIIPVAKTDMRVIGYRS